MSSSKEDEAKVRTTIPSSSSFCYSLLGLGLGLVLVLYCDVEAANALRLAPPRHRPSWHGGDSALSRPSQEDSTHHHRGIVLPQPPQPQPSPSPPAAQPPSAPPQPTPSSSPPRPTPTPPAAQPPSAPPQPTPSSSPPRPTPTPPSSNTSSSSSNCSEIDGMTEGPYWVEEDLQASDIRQDLLFGLRLNLIFKVDNISTSSLSLGSENNNNNGSCEAVENVRIDVWQARYDGIYSDVEKDNTQGETWLRGYQFTNSSGYACFTTIYPGWYSGRTPHIHVRVRTYDSDGNTTLYEDTSQLFFNDTINEEVFNNVYPYNTRGGKRDTYNSGDSLFTISNVIPLVGNYTDGYTSSIVELNIPFSISSPYSNAFIRRISNDDDFDQHHT